MTLQTRQIYKFGDFGLDATAKILFRRGEPIKLARKAVETLLALAEHPDQVLTKDELIRAIWEGRVVDEANLIQNIAVIRRTMQVASGQPGCIETFPGRGYRLIGPIVADEETLHGPEHSVPPDPAVPAGQVPVLPMEAGAIVPATVRPTRRGRRLAYLIPLLAALAVVSVWIFASRNANREHNEQSFRRTAVARLGGKEFQPAISQDGRSVAFALDRGDGGLTSLWIKTAGQSRPTVLGRSGWDFSSPAWSPDGKSVAYLRFGAVAGELVVSLPDGTGERVITSVFRSRFGLASRHLDWAPDGRSFAVDDAETATDPFAIYLISETGEHKRLTSPSANAVGDVAPRFSPDGKTLSFIRVFHRMRQGLYTVDLSTNKVRAVSDDSFQISDQDWTPDGKRILLGWNRTGEFRLWRMEARTGSSKLDASGVYGDAPIQISVARKANALLYSILQQDLNIWRFDVSADAKANAWTPVINSSAEDASPQYSPDGTEICFRSDRTGEEQLWVAAADGSNLQQVTRGSLRPSVGRWSPDGRSIVFNDSREGDLYVTTGRNGDWQTRSVGTKGRHPVFSTDGKWVYAGRNGQIWRISVGSGSSSSISHTYGLSFGLSTDGNSLYFVRGLTSGTLWRMEIASGLVDKVLDGLVPYCTSCWAASSNGIYYLGNTKSVNGQAIYFHSFGAAHDRLVAEYPEPLLALGGGPFSLSPDGRYLLCVRVDPANCDVMRMDGGS